MNKPEEEAEEFLEGEALLNYCRIELKFGIEHLRAHRNYIETHLAKIEDEENRLLKILNRLNDATQRKL